jgi:hypothetical protein
MDGNFWINICHIPDLIAFPRNVYAYYPNELPDKKMDGKPAGSKAEKYKTVNQKGLKNFSPFWYLVYTSESPF